jgi:hypothetical protein
MIRCVGLEDHGNIVKVGDSIEVEIRGKKDTTFRIGLENFYSGREFQRKYDYLLGVFKLHNIQQRETITIPTGLATVRR